jgi:hypothetical protein
MTNVADEVLYDCAVKSTDDGSHPRGFSLNDECFFYRELGNAIVKISVSGGKYVTSITFDTVFTENETKIKGDLVLRGKYSLLQVVVDETGKTKEECIMAWKDTSEGDGGASSDLLDAFLTGTVDTVRCGPISAIGSGATAPRIGKQVNGAGSVVRNVF